MNDLSITLTETDHCILNSYSSFLDGLSQYLGDGIEIVLHSLENLDQSVIKIINGHYSGRKVGAPITDLALSMLSKIRATGTNPYIVYFSKSKQNEPIKAATIAILGEGQRFIGLVCMNFYLNISLISVLESFSPPQQCGSPITENFAENIGDIIEKALIEARNQVMGDPKIPASYKNKEIITILDDQGIFNLKDSVVTVSELLGISKNTVYLHLRNQHSKK